jgi:hypothetical protein
MPYSALTRPSLPGASRFIDGALLQLRQLLPQGPSSGASAAAANKIVRFLRNSGLPAPQPAQVAAVAEGLADVASAVSRGLSLSVASRFWALGTLLSLGGDSAQNAQPSTQLLLRLAKGRAKLDLTFQALDGLVTETTPWPDLSGRRAALQSLLARSRGQIQTLAASQPEKAAQQLAALFKLFGLRVGSAGAADQGRLAVARDILTRSALAKPARPRQPPTIAARRASTPVSGPVSTIAAARPQPAARGRDAVQALGEAIRAYNAETGASRQAALNDALALARSLKASDGGQWTPATLRDYASYDRQAARALYGATPQTAPARLPVRSSRIERTIGATVGTEAGAINEKAAIERAALLRNLAEQAYRKLKAGMNLGGFEEYLSNLARQHRVPLQDIKAATRARSVNEFGDMKGVQASAGRAGEGSFLNGSQADRNQKPPQASITRTSSIGLGLPEFDAPAFARQLVTGAVSSREFEQTVRAQWQLGPYIFGLPGNLAASIKKMAVASQDLHYAEAMFSNKLIFGTSGAPAGNLLQAPSDASASTRRDFRDFMRAPHVHQRSRIGLVVEGHSVFYTKHKIAGRDFVIEAPVFKNDLIFWPGGTFHTFSTQENPFWILSCSPVYSQDDLEGGSVDALMRGIDFDKLPRIDYGTYLNIKESHRGRGHDHL